MEVKKESERVDWAFLEEIDAPMWVDLTLISTQEEDDDDDSINCWFEALHPFHHLSSYHLLNHGGNPSSPTLPPSVSKSRGNHSTYSKCGHPINTFSTKPARPQTSTTSSTSSSLCVTGTNSASLTMSHPSITKLSFNASNTCIKSKPQDGLLLAARASLRRSHITRQPTRVEVKEQRHPKDLESSSTNSSVASTTNLAPTVYRNTTPQSKHVAQMNYNINYKLKHSNKLDGQHQVAKFCSNRQEKLVAATQEISKNKTSLQMKCKKSSRLRNVQNSHTDDKKPTNFIATTNARNTAGQIILSRGTASKENNIRSLLWPRKALKHSLVGKTEDALDLKGSDNAWNKSKKTTKVATRVYFR